MQCVAVSYSNLQCMFCVCLHLPVSVVCRSVLQCVAVCCSVSQCVAVCCSESGFVSMSVYVLCTFVSVFICSSVCCSALQCVAVCCSVLQCVAVCCSAL